MNKDISHFFLNNQLKVIYAYDNSNPLVSLQLFIKTGSIFEKPEESGFSHFLEHLVFKSTKNYPKNTLMEKASFYGGSINAYTEYESTCFYINLPSEFLSQGIQLLAELAFNANFSKEDFIAEKKVVIEELKQYQNDPEDTLVEKIPTLINKNNPYCKVIIGDLENLKQCKWEDLNRFYQEKYQPQNAFFCIAGDFDKERLKTILEKEFIPWKSSLPTTPKYEYSPNFDYPINYDFQHIKSKLNQNILTFVIPELSDNNPDSYALSLIGKAFAIGNNSRLYQRLYTKEKLIDSIKVNSISGLYDGLMIILIYPRKNADIYKITEIFLEEYKNLSRFGLRPDEIENVKRELLNSSAYVYEYMEVLAQTLGTEEILGDYNKFFEYENEILKINRNDISDKLNKYYNFQMLHIISTGKFEVEKEKIFKLYNNSIQKKINNHSNEKTFYHQFPNGLKILLKKVPGKSICGISLALRVSQLDESENELGLNQLTSGLLLYGNEKRDYSKCLDFCTTNGIQFAVSCGKEVTKLRLKCFSDNLLPSLEFIHDVLYTPIFPYEHINNLKKSFISNINRIKDYPQHQAVMLWKKMIFGKYSNLLSKDGTTKTLNSFNRKKIFSWYKNKILNAPATLCIVGDISFDDVILCCERFFNDKQFSTDLPYRSIYLSPTEKSKQVINTQSNQSIINLGGFCMPGKDIQYRGAMNVLSQIIGGDINSRMFNLLREKYGIAYSVEFDYDLLDDIGYFDMFSIVDKTFEEEAINLMYSIQQDIKDNGVTSEELQITKNYILGQNRMDEESVLSQAQTLSTLLVMGFDYNFYLDRENRIKNVTNQLIQSIANEYFNPEDEYLHILR
ncbi:MAG: insulinase family protein [Candidatus Cloacimonetes bacterium]|nr:insulinase family protein [Candidatus Cloacimonadota bacterium]